MVIDDTGIINKFHKNSGTLLFPERLRTARKECGLTQRGLAEILNVAAGTVTMWEAGKREPGIDKLCDIADALGVSTDYLLGCSDEKDVTTTTLSPKPAQARQPASATEAAYTAKEVEFLMTYVTLDSFGKASVDSLIHTELLRCHEQGTVAGAGGA